MTCLCMECGKPYLDPPCNMCQERRKAQLERIVESLIKHAEQIQNKDRESAVDFRLAAVEIGVLLQEEIRGWNEHVQQV